MITEIYDEPQKLGIIFKNARIVGLAGNKHSGKTNNMCQLIKEYTSIQKTTPIYVYGMPQEVIAELNKIGVLEISSLSQLIGKKNCILILDEFQKLKLNDRRYKDDLNEFVDFVYHNGVYVLLSSPNIREFNSVIGGVIEKWCLKSVRLDQCVQGSQLKKVVERYKGRYKSLGSIHTQKNELLVINDDYEVVLDINYYKECDHKTNVRELF
jgi:tRNA(Met) C34 N-acetyltransferase TmcA